MAAVAGRREREIFVSEVEGSTCASARSIPLVLSAEHLARESLTSLERLSQLAPPRYTPHLLWAVKVITCMIESGDLGARA